MASTSYKPTVVYASNGNDIEFLNASIFTLRKQMSNNVDIYLLSDVVIDEEVPHVKKVIDPTPVLSKLGFFPDAWNRRWPYATLYRLAIPLLREFKDLDRILYIDTDVLAQSTKVADLFTMPVEDFEIIGAKDSNGDWTRIQKCVREDLGLKASVKIIEKLWIDHFIKGRTYINGGVLIWCLENIRRNGMDWYSERLRWFWEAETRGKFEFLDQDFINSMMYSSPNLDRRYNFLADLDYGIPKPPYMTHYIADSKPRLLTDAYAMGYESPLLACDDKPKVVVYASDGNDADRLKLSAASVRKFLGKNVKFYILTELSTYPALPSATLINPADKLKELGFHSRDWNRGWPFSCLYRLAIPLLDELKDYDMILYLDTDTLIRSYAANKLFDLKPHGYEVYGVQDIKDRQWDIEKSIKHDFSGVAKKVMYDKLWHKREKLTQGYINSGVLLEFISEIRSNGIEWYKQRLRYFWLGITQGKFHFPDQDFINVFMDVNPSLSVRFNMFCGDFGTDCIIQHFVGKSRSNMRPTAEHMGLLELLKTGDLVL